MTLILDLNPSEEQELSAQAAQEGISLAEYARRRLLSRPQSVEPAPSPLDLLSEDMAAKRPFNVMQFAAIAPRTAAEIEAHLADIRSGRDEWDQRDWRQTGQPW